MREFLEIFSVRPQDIQYFLPTRFAGLATLLTSGARTPLGPKYWPHSFMPAAKASAHTPLRPIWEGQIER
jgi:hypothetical protein